MSLTKFILAGAGTLALGSCATAPATLTAEALLVAPFTLSRAEPFDVAAYFDALPQWLEVSFAGARFDAATGAMVISDLVLAPRDAPSYRLRIDRADIWDGDVAALQALMAGEIDEGKAQLFERASFQGVRSEGLQRASGAQSVAFSVDKLVYDGLAASSISVTPKESAPEMVQLIRMLAAISGAYALDAAAYSNMTLRMNESQGGEVVINIAQGFVHGYDSGRNDYERIDGLTLTTHAPTGAMAKQAAQMLRGAGKSTPQDKILQPHIREALNDALNNPIAFIAANAGGLTSTRTIDSIESRNVDVAGALHWLAKWELPPITQTELLDFGSIIILGDRESINGTPVLSTARIDIPAYDFYWLVPSNISLTGSGFSMDLLNYIDSSAAALNLGLTPETGSLEMQKAREALLALGLDTISGDYAMHWNWNGETGALTTGFSEDLVDLAASSFGIGLGGPSLAEWDALVREGAARDVVAERISLEGFSFSITDYQLLDRIFAYAAEEMGGTGEDLRQSMPALIRLSSVEAAQMNPRIPGYLDAIANFIAAGGTLDISANPAEPVTLKSFQSIGESAPQSLPDVLDLRITHTAR